MSLFSTRKTRVLIHRRLITALASGVALCLAVPGTAFASTHTASTTPTGAIVAHHDPGKNPSPPTISGQIISLGTGSIVVQDGSGFWRTIVLATSTSYSEGPMKVAPAASASDLAVGLDIVVEGTVDANHTSLDATSVQIQLSSVYGKVQSISTSSIVVEGNKSATTSTIDLTPQTVVFSQSKIVPLSTVTVGSNVDAFGIVQPGGALTALYLGIDTSHRGFSHASDFGFNLPNRYAVHHYVSHAPKS